jgi:hypothetical protein
MIVKLSSNERDLILEALRDAEDQNNTLIGALKNLDEVGARIVEGMLGVEVGDDAKAAGSAYLEKEMDKYRDKSNAITVLRAKLIGIMSESTDDLADAVNNIGAEQ